MDILEIFGGRIPMRWMNAARPPSIEPPRVYGGLGPEPDWRVLLTEQHNIQDMRDRILKQRMSSYPPASGWINNLGWDQVRFVNPWVPNQWRYPWQQ